MELIVVLVQPAVPENVGAAARALKTMGFAELRIVASDAHRQKGARILAHGAGDILDAACAFDDLPSALGDCDFVVGTSAKPRHGWRRQYSAKELKPLLENKRASCAKVALVFGREDSGLHTDELDVCDALTSVPLAASYPSINLAQAVMIYCYELSELQAEATTIAASEGQLRALKHKLGELLPALSFAPDSTLSQWANQRLAALGDKDIGFLHALCDKLRERL